MHSIRVRIMALTMTAILISVFALGSISILSVRRESEKTAAESMRLLCDNCASSVDSYLKGIEQSVNMVSRYAVEELSNVALVEGGVVGADGHSGLQWNTDGEPRQETLDKYLSDYVDSIEPVFRSVANRTNGVVTFYYRINPEISKQETGFLYSRDENASFVKEKLTRLERYDAGDEGRTGWYYTPLERGRPSWLEPFFNRNLNVRMISYVAPLYKAGTFIGVIGMEISYETLISQIRDIRVFETGFAALAEQDGTVVYHPWLSSGESILQNDVKFGNDFAEISSQNRNTQPILTERQGERRQMFFSTLSGGLKLIITAPVREINESGSRLANRLTVASVLILLIFSALTAVLMRRLTRPLQQLTEAAKGLAEGNYDTQLDYAGDNEIGVLTKTFQQLVDHLKIYISDLNSKAYQDAMTGVRNKGAYAISARKLDDSIRMAKKGEEPQFALIMFDCNDLKKINDTYGHEKGDEYLRRACQLICGVFPHSPVFRMGGDEFAVILQDSSYEQRDGLLRGFDQFAEVINAKAREPWEFVHIAKGVAAYDPALDADSDSVLHRADEAMYADKIRIKGSAR
ncbi:MAG: diguanylate cyclase [Ruminococcaceae bacterium]|nr:diguanylate cyclase [Oscillospiraceae bacterium]